MRGMVPEDVYALAGVADPRLSPDGRIVAFVSWAIDKEINGARSRIWLVPADGSQAPRQFTQGGQRDAAPRWSPDGGRMAFVSKREGDAAQLYVIPMTGGEARCLTKLQEDAGQAAWSPDGKRIVFAARVPDEANAEKDERKRAPRRIKRLKYKLDNEGWTIDRPSHLFVVAADGSEEAKQLTSGDYEDFKPAWSPDGKRIAFVSSRHADWDMDGVSDIYLVDASGGAPQRLTGGDGACNSPSWSPDGTKIAYQYAPGIFDDPRFTQIAVIDVATRERRILTAPLDRNCGPYPELREPIWDGPSLLFAVEDSGNTHLYKVRSDGSSAPERVIGGELAVAGYDAAAGTIVHVRTTPTALTDLYCGDRVLTEVGKSYSSERGLVAAERFTAVSADGSKVDAWIMRPPGLKPGGKCPLLLNIHGGPFAQYGNRFFDEFQVYAAAGYAVVFSNPRGSTGGGEAWARAIRGPVNEGPGWGSVDYEDCMAVVDEAIKRYDFVDPKRLGVMGGSYGGFMTSWIVGHTNRFKAAISERGLSQWVSMWGSSDFGWDFKGYVGAFLFENFDAYVRLSPATYATNITTPLLILHSENDLRCPVEQGEHLFVTLRLLKRDVEMVRFPAEGHELSRSGSPVHRVTRFEIILDWLERRLKV